MNLIFCLNKWEYMCEYNFILNLSLSTFFYFLLKLLKNWKTLAALRISKTFYHCNLHLHIINIFRIFLRCNCVDEYNLSIRFHEIHSRLVLSYAKIMLKAYNLFVKWIYMEISEKLRKTWGLKVISDNYTAIKKLHTFTLL